MSLIHVIIVGLAAYRVGRMLAYESGPFRIFERLRTNIDRRYPAIPGEPPHRFAWVNEGFNCPLCLSFWLALVFFWMPLWFIGPLAAAGVGLFIHYQGQ